MGVKKPLTLKTEKLFQIYLRVKNLRWNILLQENVTTHIYTDESRQTQRHC